MILGEKIDYLYWKKGYDHGKPCDWQMRGSGTIVGYKMEPESWLIEKGNGERVLVKRKDIRPYEAKSVL